MDLTKQQKNILSVLPFGRVQKPPLRLPVSLDSSLHFIESQEDGMRLLLWWHIAYEWSGWVCVSSLSSISNYVINIGHAKVEPNQVGHQYSSWEQEMSTATNRKMLDHAVPMAILAAKREKVWQNKRFIIFTLIVLLAHNPSWTVAIGTTPMRRGEETLVEDDLIRLGSTLLEHKFGLEAHAFGVQLLRLIRAIRCVRGSPYQFPH